MSFTMIYTWMWEHCDSKAELGVLAYIYRFYEDGKVCYMTYDTFAKTIKCGRATIIRAVEALEKKNAIIKTGKKSTSETSTIKKGKSNIYKINESTIEKWISEFEGEETKKASRKKSKQPPQSEPETEFEKILTDKGSSEPQSFAPNSLDEVKTYIEEKGYISDAQQFFNHYERKGWKKPWRESLDNWEDRERKYAKNKPAITKTTYRGMEREHDSDYYAELQKATANRF